MCELQELPHIGEASGLQAIEVSSADFCQRYVGLIGKIGAHSCNQSLKISKALTRSLGARTSRQPSRKRHVTGFKSQSPGGEYPTGQDCIMCPPLVRGELGTLTGSVDQIANAEKRKVPQREIGVLLPQEEAKNAR